jgi:hypothetical protein
VQEQAKPKTKNAFVRFSFFLISYNGQLKFKMCKTSRNTWDFKPLLKRERGEREGEYLRV